MKVIRKKIDFTVLGNPDLINDTIKYFKQSGFRYIDNNTEEKLRFERGSIASNMWTFNPLKWKSEIEIEISGQKIKANFNINTVGQIATQKEEKLWDSFIENYRKHLINNKFDFKTENKKTLKSTKKNSLKYIWWALLGGLIGGVPAGLIAYWTGINSIVSIGSSVGAIGLLTKKINDDKKKSIL
ncbi:hypothetical protein ACYE2N_01135 [Flavobacterium sp. MAHUQ-51]|uniref:hypothetical protein n=1 Tax=Flavobacterium sp. GCM10022190 TaxID=3252639 RepID=UPI00361C9523